MAGGRLAAASGMAALLAAMLSGCAGATACPPGPMPEGPHFSVDGTAWLKANPGATAMLCVQPANQPGLSSGCQPVDSGSLTVTLVPRTDTATLSHTTRFTITVTIQQDGTPRSTSSFVEHLTSNNAPKSHCGPGPAWSERLILNPDGTLTDAGYDRS